MAHKERDSAGRNGLDLIMAANNKNMRPLSVRFAEQYIESGYDECWAWLGNTSSNGYGSIKLNYKTLSAHRVSYQLHRGPIPEAVFVCHTCDNKKCVNPSHLFLGTAQDNNTDMHNKGRQRPVSGENHHWYKFTDREIADIRVAVGTQQQIADRFGISRPYVSQIRSGIRRNATKRAEMNLL